MADATPDEGDTFASSVQTLTIDLRPDDQVALDHWIKARETSCSRAEAILTLTRQALTNFTPNSTTIRGEFDPPLSADEEVT